MAVLTFDNLHCDGALPFIGDCHLPKSPSRDSFIPNVPERIEIFDLDSKAPSDSAEISYWCLLECRNFFVRHDRVPLNYDYKDGITVLAPKIEGGFGAESSPRRIEIDETPPFPGQQISSLFYSWATVSRLSLNRSLWRECGSNVPDFQNVYTKARNTTIRPDMQVFRPQFW
jgi:hypothetical protein